MNNIDAHVGFLDVESSASTSHIQANSTTDCLYCGRKPTSSGEEVYRCQTCSGIVCSKCIEKELRQPHSPEHVMEEIQVGASQQQTNHSPMASVKETNVVMKQYDDEGSKIINNYLVERLLGQGSFGKVKLAQHAVTREKFAIKIMNKSILARARQGGMSALESVKHEIAIMKRLQHRNVARLIEVIDDPDCAKLYLITEYLERGPIFTVGKDKPLPTETVRHYAADIVAGLQYLHAQNIIHRDIKPDNILLSKEGVCKLMDFGVAANVSDDAEGGTIGTPAFMAPEIIAGGALSPSLIDSWALGVTLYAITFGVLPFRSDNFADLSQEIIECDIDWAPNNQEIDPQLLDLLQKLLDINCLARINIEGCIQHPFLAGLVERNDAKVIVSNEDSEHAIVMGRNVRLPLLSAVAVMITVSRAAGNFKKSLGKTADRREDRDHHASHHNNGYGSIVNSSSVIQTGSLRSSSVSSMVLSKSAKCIQDRLLQLNDKDFNCSFGRLTYDGTNHSVDDMTHRKRSLSISYSHHTLSVILSDTPEKGKQTRTLPKEEEVMKEENCDVTVEELMAIAAASPTVLDFSVSHVHCPVMPNCEGIAHISSLTLSKNSMYSIGDACLVLNQLTYLKITDNELKNFPANIDCLGNLKYLDLSYNELQSVPESVAMLSNLEVLLLDYNCIETFPDGIFAITSLQSVGLVENVKLQKFPITPSTVCRFEPKLSLAINNREDYARQYDALPQAMRVAIDVTWNKVFPDRIIPNIYLGSLRCAQNPQVFSWLGVNRILTCGRNLEVISPLPAGVQQLKVQMDDIPNFDISRHLDEVSTYIHDNLEQGNSLLIHCFAGISRSSSALIAYLIRYKGMKVEDALKLVKDGRACANPNPGFMEHLKLYEERYLPHYFETVAHQHTPPPTPSAVAHHTVVRQVAVVG